MPIIITFLPRDYFSLSFDLRISIFGFFLPNESEVRRWTRVGFLIDLSCLFSQS
jgi:hypothetical protein